MKIRIIMKTARSVSFELEGYDAYRIKEDYDLYLNGAFVSKIDKAVETIYDLKPETKYEIQVIACEKVIVDGSFETEKEFVTLNVRDFGAKGDGIKDDTLSIQAAIMACPKNGRVLVPKGTYAIYNLFLKSHLRLEIAKGAELRAETKREKFAVLPGVIQSYDETDEYNLGSWEGNPLDSFAGIITGLYVEDVKIYGEGILNGNAGKENWWKNPKVRNIAFRPRLMFLNHCESVMVQGIQMMNSPAWVVHPYFSNHLKFISVSITNPSDSPNTDGIDPESCKNVEIAGVHFSLGDDCIAIKSGKIYMGTTYQTPSEDIHIHHCLMENGHGAVTLGSEMSGGIKNVLVEKCTFSHTDRGLRVKTRRGRGKYAVIDQVVFEKIEMDEVKTPFVVNSFYFCDPDGKSEYVQSREKYPVNDQTPEIKKIRFEDIVCSGCHAAVAYFEGLPERKIEEIIIRNMETKFSNEVEPAVPAMTEGVEACVKKGVFAKNIKKLVLENVKIYGHEGDVLLAEEVDVIKSDLV